MRGFARGVSSSLVIMAAVMACPALSKAGEPVRLNSMQLDSVSAGAITTKIVSTGTAYGDNASVSVRNETRYGKYVVVARGNVIATADGADAETTANVDVSASGGKVVASPNWSVTVPTATGSLSIAGGIIVVRR